MNVLVVTEKRFHRSGGRVVTPGPLGYAFWARYLDVFDEVGVLARTHETPSPSVLEVTGPGVRVVEVPAYLGPSQYLRSLPGIHRAVRGAASRWDAVVVRAPSALGTVLLSGVVREGRPFGLEVIGDPREAFARGAVRHPLRVFFRWWFSRQLRRQCRQAVAFSYVNQGLRARYPPRPGAPAPVVVFCPGDDLPKSAMVERARAPEAFGPPFRLVTVCSLEQAYKGVDVLIRAVEACRRRDLPVSLAVVGGGRERPRLEALARSLGLAHHVRFVGEVPSPEVFVHLRTAHLFVLASRTEGLPQSMIEAMAGALPCVGTAVGGMLELLSPEDLVPACSVSALAEKVAAVLVDPVRLAAMSVRNLGKAREYTAETLRPTRRAFLEAVRDATLEARRTNGAPPQDEGRGGAREG